MSIFDTFYQGISLASNFQQVFSLVKTTIQ